MAENFELTVTRKIRDLEIELNKLKSITKPIPETSGPWTAYTPVWSSAGGVTTLGNGILTGRYYPRGKLIVAVIDFQWGSTTSATGTRFMFTLPFADANTAFYIGPLSLYHNGYYYGGTCQLERNFGRINAIASIEASLDYVNPTYPFTWDNNDELRAQITYEIP